MRCCSFSNMTTESANAVQFVSNAGCRVPWVFSLRVLEFWDMMETGIGNLEF